MDQQLLRDLRTEVAESLSSQRREDTANGLPTMSSGPSVRCTRCSAKACWPRVPTS